MTRKRLFTDSKFETDIGYSRAVIDGDYIFVSGTTGYNYTDMTISDNAAKQAEQCFKNIEAVLFQAGSSLNDIVRVTYILPDKRDFEQCWPVTKAYLKDALPAATMFEAGLLDDKMKIEIQVTARKNA